MSLTLSSRTGERISNFNHTQVRKCHQGMESIKNHFTVIFHPL